MNDSMPEARLKHHRSGIGKLKNADQGGQKTKAPWSYLCGLGTTIFFAITMWVGSPAWAQPLTSARRAKKLEPHVPFVGCRSDGQLGPEKAPRGNAKALPLSSETARQLAYYQAQQGFGVLAPRGWYCFGVYGSGGDALYVSPQPINSAIVFSTDWTGFAGPAIEIAHNYGGTSGRYGVAKIIARVFPARRSFVNKVIEQDKEVGIDSASSFPFGPYPKDKLTYKGKAIVEYQTPAHTDGLGTDSRLQKSGNPISGVAILVGPTPDLLLLSVRLSPKMPGLTSTIIQQVEREATQPHPWVR